jgi:hypothetical protein
LFFNKQFSMSPIRRRGPIRRFEVLDKAKPPPAGAVLFTGSSSIARWSDVAKHFPDYAVIKRGFGGSTIPEVNHFLDRIVLPHRPSAGYRCHSRFPASPYTIRSVASVRPVAEIGGASAAELSAHLEQQHGFKIEPRFIPLYKATLPDLERMAFT